MANNFGVIVLFKCPCGMDHESDAEIKIKLNCFIWSSLLKIRLNA